MAAQGLKKSVAWLLGGSLGLGAAIGGYLGAVVAGWLPPPDRVRCEMKTAFHDPAPGTYFTILLAPLAGDSGNQTNHVAAMFRGVRGLEIVRGCRTLRIDPHGPQSQALAAAERQGREWLDRYKADLLVWGEVAKADEALRLWFLSREQGAAVDSTAYALETTVPVGFGEDFAAQLQAVALAQVAPATEQAGTYLVAALEPVAAKLGHLLADPPAGLSVEQIAALHHAYGLAMYTLGEQSGKREWLDQAVAAYGEALKEYRRDRVPLAWAMTQNNLGTALQSLGERTGEAAYLEQAVAAFREALTERRRDRVPLAWAMTQSNLGNALAVLGERTGEAADLEQAVAAYREALKKQTRDRVPLDWAATQNNLGNALQRLGERTGEAAYLQDAVAAFREALEERRRDRVPLAWAMTQSNLGDALTSLGERRKDAALVREAVAAQQAALDVFRQLDAPAYVAAAEENLAQSRQVLAALEAEEGRAQR